jgi:hypothetical protein
MTNRENNKSIATKLIGLIVVSNLMRDEEIDEKFGIISKFLV